jgi:uncharacterized membrane protein YgdD (TMEM256/DUF423 family)
MAMHKAQALITATLGMLAVILGAFGAHALKGVLSEHYMDVWKTAVMYQMFHVLVSLSLILNSKAQAYTLTVWFFLLGIVLFSGSLFLLAVTGVTWIGAITPIGGICFVIGWARLVMDLSKKQY